jgi:hypothetical protein
MDFEVSVFFSLSLKGLPMAQLVDIPAEHYLITNQDALVTHFVQDTLAKFALEKLLESKLTSRSFKAGLNFNDAHRASQSRRKLSMFIKSFIEKESPFLKENETYANSNDVFLVKPLYSDNLTVKTIYDKSVFVYMRRVNEKLRTSGIPLNIMLVSDDNSLDRAEWCIQPTGSSRSTLHYYKLLFIIPEILTFFRNLSRKARFADENAKNRNRSKHSGYRPRAAAVPRTRPAGGATRTPVPA